MAAKKRSTLGKPKTRATRPAAKPSASRPVRLPLVLSAKSATDAKQVREVLGKLVDDGLLQPLGFEQARAFLADARDWPGPGYVVLMR